jgi:taurine dioxygenase
MKQSETKIEVTPGESGFGATVGGIVLGQPLGGDAVETILDAWARHGVIVFPDQPLDVEGREAFTRAHGDFGHDPFIAPMEDHPNVLELRREPDEKAGNFGAGWHSDWSFQACPPSGTILHSKVIPPVGGNTLYADAHRAWEALSSTMQSMLEGLNAIHSAALPYGRKGIFAKDTEARTMKILVSDEAEKTEVHPLVRTHPVTGRKALFVNPVYTVAIEGLKPSENYTILKFLYDHITQEQFVYRHEWQPDMLVMWDNRSTLHYAEGGYDGHLRVLHRTTLAGDRPV